MVQPSSEVAGWETRSWRTWAPRPAGQVYEHALPNGQCASGAVQYQQAQSTHTALAPVAAAAVGEVELDAELDEASLLVTLPVVKNNLRGVPSQNIQPAEGQADPRDQPL